ncbi:MAG: flippase, partial [Candidatus Aenigmatarchaeota archaeon]
MIILIGTLVGSGLNYIIRLMIARHYNPSGYGLFSIGFAIFNVSIAISVLGLNEGTTRWISKNTNQRRMKGIILSSLKITIPASILISGLIFLFSNKISLLIGEPQLLNILKLLSIGIPFGVLAQIYVGSIRGLKNTVYKIYVYDISWPILRLIFISIIIFFGYSLDGIAISYSLGITITSLISFYLLNKILPFNKIKSLHFPKKKLLSFSWPLMISSILILAVSWMDIFMLGFLKTSKEVGIYNAALPTSSSLIFILYSFKYILLPESTDLLHKNKIKKLQNIYQLIVRLIFLISLPMFLIMVIFPSNILEVFFGNVFSVGGPTLAILSVGYFYASIVGPTGDLLISSGKTKFFMITFVIIATINFIINFLLIPTLSYYGAAIALTSSFIVGWSFSIFLIHREFKIIPFKKNLIKPLYIGLIVSMP